MAVSLDSHNPEVCTHQCCSVWAHPGSAAVGAGVAGAARQRVQHQGYIEGDGHELVAVEEPGEAVHPLANKGGFLQAAPRRHLLPWIYAMAMHYHNMEKRISNFVFKQFIDLTKNHIRRTKSSQIHATTTASCTIKACR